MVETTNVHGTGGRSGEIASMRRMLLALAVGGVVGCLLWMAAHL